MRSGRQRDDDDRKQPGPLLPARKTARQPDQGKPERERNDARDVRHFGR